MFLHQPRQRIQHPRAFGPVFGPGRLRLARGRNRRIHIGPVGLCNLRQNHPVRRIKRFKIAPVRRHKRPVNEQVKTAVVAFKPCHGLAGAFGGGAIFHAV